MCGLYLIIQTTLSHKTTHSHNHSPIPCVHKLMVHNTYLLQIADLWQENVFHTYFIWICTIAGVFSIMIYANGHIFPVWMGIRLPRACEKAKSEKYLNVFGTHNYSLLSICYHDLWTETQSATLNFAIWLHGSTLFN